jgi:hypothetical protein
MKVIDNVVRMTDNLSAKLPLQPVKAALPLEELAFLLAANPIDRIHSCP